MGRPSNSSPYKISRELILNKINVVDSGCWEWNGSMRPDGYGKIVVNYRQYLVHRLAFHIWNNFDLKSPLLVCHRCNNKRCCNPEHLYDGTHSENIRDAISAGTWKPCRAHRNGQTPLNWEKVREIRRLKPTHSLKALAKKFKCHSTTIYLIVHNKRWKEENETK